MGKMWNRAAAEADAPHIPDVDLDLIEYALPEAGPALTREEVEALVEHEPSSVNFSTYCEMRSARAKLRAWLASQGEG